MRRVQVHDQCMGVKTITIDLEAYDLLARHKREGQSFSQVIKAHFGPQPTAGRFLERMRAIRVAPATLTAIERQVSDRKRHPARAATR
jgi:predicted CopG family antitoxin